MGHFYLCSRNVSICAYSPILAFEGSKLLLFLCFLSMFAKRVKLYYLFVYAPVSLGDGNINKRLDTSLGTWVQSNYSASVG